MNYTVERQPQKTSMVMVGVRVMIRVIVMVSVRVRINVVLWSGLRNENSRKRISRKWDSRK